MMWDAVSDYDADPENLREQAPTMPCSRCQRPVAYGPPCQPQTILCANCWDLAVESQKRIAQREQKAS